jgi:DNA-binding NarL/FixJ family response regulator
VSRETFVSRHAFAANELDDRVESVDKHIAQFFTKLGVANRASAAARVVKALAG